MSKFDKFLTEDKKVDKNSKEARLLVHDFLIKISGTDWSKKELKELAEKVKSGKFNI